MTEQEILEQIEALNKQLEEVRMQSADAGLLIDEAERELQHQEDLQRIRGFRMIDDDFMNVVFDDNVEGTELLLRIILNNPTINVNSVKTQRVIKNLLGRDVWLDIDANDDTGKEYNIERALKDKCCVVNNNSIDEESKKRLEDFIDSVQNNENDELRVVRYEKVDNENYITILDLQYDEEIILNIDYTRSNFNNKEIIYVGKFNYIKKSSVLENKTAIYVENLMKQRATICIY